MKQMLSIKIRNSLFLFTALVSLLLLVLPLESSAADMGFGLTGAIRKKVKKIDEKVRQEKERQEDDLPLKVVPVVMRERRRFLALWLPAQEGGSLKHCVA